MMSYIQRLLKPLLGNYPSKQKIVIAPSGAIFLMRCLTINTYMKIDVYSLLVTKPHNAHYLSRYIKFIKSCDNTSSDQVTEDHHILPKSKDLFPEYKSFKKYPENKANLTLRQHYLAHRMLWRAYRGEMARAFTMMCHRTKSFSSRDYENARQYQKTLMTGVNNPNHDGHHYSTENIVYIYRQYNRHQK